MPMEVGSGQPGLSLSYRGSWGGEGEGKGTPPSFTTFSLRIALIGNNDVVYIVQATGEG